MCPYIGQSRGNQCLACPDRKIKTKIELSLGIRRDGLRILDFIFVNYFNFF